LSSRASSEDLSDLEGDDSPIASLLNAIFRSAAAYKMLLDTAHRAVHRRQLSCVCLLVTFVSPAKTAEPIEMLFGKLTLVGPRNHVLDEGQDSSQEGAICGVAWPTEKYSESLISRMYAAKNNGIGVTPAADGTAAAGSNAPTGRCRITLSPPVKNTSPAMRPFVKIL